MLNAKSKDKDYIDKLPGDFIKLLNDELGLQNAKKDTSIGTEAIIGIDDAFIPEELAQPYAKLFDSRPDITHRVNEARSWAEQSAVRLSTDFAESVKKRVVISRVLAFFGIQIVANKVDRTVNEQFQRYRDQILDALTPLKLLGDKEYLEAELQKRKEFYNRHVRLVYGGGARNNAELFIPQLPAGSPETPNWDRRPSMAQILTYRPGGVGKPTLLATLKKNPGVGLIFIRTANESISSNPSVPLPETMDILVTDPFDNKGTIRVRKDVPTGQFVYSYRVEKESAEDPLGLNLGDREWHSGTYSEWTDRSVKARDYYRNA